MNADSDLINNTNTNIRKLNIVMTYPIHWSEYKLMENFIQNFYDAIGYKEFGDKFSYSYKNETIVMKSEIGFAWEWLEGLGVSSKRVSNRYYAGKFGEGFKLACLVAYRDYGMAITMQSRNWRLKVIEIEDHIEDIPVQFLAYRIEILEKNVDTMLLLENVKEKYYSVFQHELNSFYYKSNSDFGKLIFETEQYAVYHTSDKAEKPQQGALYISLQRRAILKMPVIFCNHCYDIEDDDRERYILSNGDFVDSILEIIDHMPSEKKYELLIAMRSCWNGKYADIRKRKYINYIIEAICNALSRCQVMKERFYNEYNDIVVADFSDFVLKRNKHMANQWFLHSEYRIKRKRVLQCFHKLGIEDVEELCRRNNGFIATHCPNDLERKCINILEECARDLFEGLYCYDEFPNYRIINDYAGIVEGTAHVIPKEEKIVNSYGMVVKSEITEINLRNSLFKRELFAEAFVVFMHELLHEFGGDSSTQFHKALMLMNELLLKKEDSLTKYEIRWIEIFSD